MNKFINDMNSLINTKFDDNREQMDERIFSGIEYVQNNIIEITNEVQKNNIDMIYAFGIFCHVVLITIKIYDDIIGNLIDDDINKIIDYCRKNIFNMYDLTSKLGNNNGHYQLGKYYQFIADNSKKSVDEHIEYSELSEKYYKMSADNGNIDGMYQIGKLHLQSPTPNIAFKYLSSGAEKNDNRCIHYLGIFHERQSEHNLAIKYFISGVNNKYDESIISLLKYMTPLALYYNVNNNVRQFVLDTFNTLLMQKDIDLINNYIQNGKKMICDYCYLDKICIELDSQNICPHCHK